MCSSDLDIGVHQDGLVHISALANRYVKDPHEVVKPGQIVKVRVIEVDVKRQRIALTMRLDDAAGSALQRRPQGDRPPATSGKQDRPQRAQAQRPARDSGREAAAPSAMALAFAKLKNSK